jgi:hypothetical protein
VAGEELSDDAGLMWWTGEDARRTKIISLPPPEFLSPHL